MSASENVVTAVRRALVRSVVGCVAGLSLGAGVAAAGAAGGAWDSAGALDGRVVGVLDTGDNARATSAASADARLQRRVTRLTDRLDCSSSGLGAHVIPASALVMAGGRVRVVPFAEGWTVHRGERAGRLLAVCRHEALR